MKVMLHRRLVPLAVTAAVVATAALAGCSGRGAVSQDVSGSNGYQTGDPALKYIAVAHRHAASGVSGTLLDGRHFDLAQWRGKVVVVNFWESDCAPCVAESPALQQVYAQNKANGVEFLGIDIKDDRYRAAAFDANNHITYPSLFDPSNLLALRFHGVPPNATPTTVVLDRAGRIAARQSGEILYTQLRDLVARVLAEPA